MKSLLKKIFDIPEKVVQSIAVQEKFTVEQIHAEIDSAQERLLKQAMEIIGAHEEAGPDVVIETAHRLKMLGFTKTELVQIADKKMSEQQEKELVVVKSKNQATRIQHFQNTYPFLKFLTEEELERICKKYGLVFAPVSNYIKNVPEKNLTEIEKAQPLKYEDSRPVTYKLNIRFCDDVPMKVREWFQNKEFTNNSASALSDRALRDVCPIKFEGRYLYMGSIETVLVNKTGLFIAAPADHFDMKGLSKETNFGFFEKTVTKIDNDPIVFRYVFGGIQVLTKWGVEGEDPALIVPRLN